MHLRRAVAWLLLAGLPCAWGADDAGLRAPVAPNSPTVVTTESVQSAAVAIDEAQRAHVIIVTSRPRTLEHVTISREGAVERDVIDPHPPSGAPSIAVDFTGHLYVAIEGRVYARSEAGWSPVEGFPPCEVLVRAGADLVCGFIIKSTAPGTHGRWTFGIVGDAMGCCLPWAWYLRNHKLVIARQDGHAGWTWTVVDGNTDRTVERFALGGAKDGTVHAMYAVAKTGAFMAKTDRLGDYYVRLPAVATADTGTAAGGYAAASGRVLVNWVTGGEMRPGSGGACLSVDGASGTALLLPGGEAPYVTGSGADPVRAVELLGLRCNHVTDLAADGGGRTHVIYAHEHRTSRWRAPDYYDLCYRLRDQTGWSQPVGLGELRSDAVGMNVGLPDRLGRTTLIASNGDGSAFAVWIDPERRLVARWIGIGAATPRITEATDERGPDEGAVTKRCAAAGFPPADPSQDSQRTYRTDDSPMPLQAAAMLLPAGERAEHVQGYVLWYGEVAGAFAQGKKRVRGEVEDGDLIIGDQALVFSRGTLMTTDGSTIDAATGVHRIPYVDIETVDVKSFGLNRWVLIRTKDGHVHSFAVHDPESWFADRVATAALGELCRSKLRNSSTHSRAKTSS